MNAPVRSGGLRKMMWDTLASMITGLNTSKDRTTGLVWAVNELTQGVVEAMYRGDWVARKIVNAPAQDATRQWRQWQAENNQIEEIEKIEKAFHIQAQTKSGLVKARLYGGAALILGVNDGKQPEEELDIENVQKGSLLFVHAVSKYELGNELGQLETDLMSPYFGQPRMYSRQVKGGDRVLIHPSRIIRIMGEEYPDPNMSSDGWGESVLQAVHDACRNAGLVTQAVATLMDELKVDVIKIPDLTKQLGDQESSDRLTERLGYGMLSKSTVNALVMDSDDEWATRQLNTAGLPDVIKTYLLIAAGAADIPATRLLGQSPGGLNATGESDVRNYYDSIASHQVNQISPMLDRLDQIIVRSALGTYDENIFYEWNSLWQTSEAEEAEIAAKKAATFKIDIDTMIIPTDALKKGRINQLIEAGTYPGLEQAIEESDGEVVNPKLEAQLALAEKNAELNPPVPPGQQATGKKVVPFKKKAPAVKDSRFTDATPRTLYVRRDVVNADDIRQWAKDQGLPELISDLHVTIMYSRTPVDWMKVGSDYNNYNDDGHFTIQPGGVRIIEPMGNGEVISLLFTSSQLSWRHEQIKRDAEAFWDWPDFQPHITLYKMSDGNDPRDADVEPYRGKIVLGPEIFEEVK